MEKKKSFLAYSKSAGKKDLFLSLCGLHVDSVVKKMKKKQAGFQLKKNSVLLDTARHTEKNASSYLFAEPREIVCAHQYGDVKKAFDRIDRLSQKYWIAGFIAYEAAFVLEDACARFIRVRKKSAIPLLWFGAYSRPQRIYKADMQRFASVHTAPALPRLQARIGFDDYQAAFQAAKKQIAAGNTYQVNYTFDSDVLFPDSPEALYCLLRRRQPTPYCAFIRTQAWEVLSFSPELFFSRTGSKISVKPMKGTASRGTHAAQDAQQIDSLQHSQKNRAENVMIVDLLRNDLGRLCAFHSVQTERLFDVETHPTLHQMTSTITGRLRRGTTYQKIFSELFPSGSVTGAPKINTMKIIRSLERGERGVYCGAIGYISPCKKAVFNVPIRTLQKKRAHSAWNYRAGSGIVWDSRLRQEWAECHIKTGVITHAGAKELALFETILWRNGRLVYLRDHLRRLRCSAETFDFSWDEQAARCALSAIQKRLQEKEHYRCQLFLHPPGHFSWNVFALEKKATTTEIHLARLAPDIPHCFLRHKTTYRPWYQEAMQKIARDECYDIVFYDAQQYITEGARTNVFLEKNGRMYTPPLSRGVLPGILRARLLRRGTCKEKEITRAMLKKADAIYCGNSVRGLQKVTFS